MHCSIRFMLYRMNINLTAISIRLPNLPCCVSIQTSTLRYCNIHAEINSTGSVATTAITTTAIIIAAVVTANAAVATAALSPFHR